MRFLVAHTAGFKKQSRVANREFTVLTGAWRSEVRDLRRQIRDRLTGILLAGAEQGSFDLAGGNGPDAATLGSATISTMCVHISEWTLEHHPLSLTELQDRFALMALRIAGARIDARLGLSCQQRAEVLGRDVPARQARPPYGRSRPPPKTASAARATAPLGSTTSLSRVKQNRMASMIASSVTVTTSSSSRELTANVRSPGWRARSPSAIVSGSGMLTRCPPPTTGWCRPP